MEKAKKTTARKPKLDLDTVYQRVLNTLVRLAPKDLTYSKISRFTGVPRPTLYYYFGNTVENLVGEAVRYGTKVFLQLYEMGEDGSSPDWNTLQYKRMVRSLRLVREYPWSPSLYLRYRNDQGAVGKTIREVEHHYLQEVAQLWKKMHGKAADLDVVKYSGALKLGLFFALASDGGLKVPQKDADLERWAREISQHLSAAMLLKLKG
jgi:hypothetical protein